MNVGSVGSQAAYQALSTLRENETAERLPDNEAAEASAPSRAPLPSYVGTKVDLEA